MSVSLATALLHFLLPDFQEGVKHKEGKCVFQGLPGNRTLL